MGTYSFADVMCAIAGPGGNFIIGSSAGVTDEGITVTMIDDKSTMIVGADGGVMHSLHVASGSTIAVYWHPASLPIWWYLRAIRLPTSAIRGRFTRSGIAARRRRDRSRRSPPEFADRDFKPAGRSASMCLWISSGAPTR